MPAMREEVTLTTADGIRLAGHWYPVEEPVGWALLLHMMPATKESYGELAGALQSHRVASLAIDFRGHGASDRGPMGYEGFTDAEQQAKRSDVDSALEWLRSKGMEEERLVLVGASIGANLAIETLAHHHAIPAAVLLSPGLNYRGIATEPLAAQVSHAQRLFLAAGGTDDADSTEAVHVLAALLGSRALVRTFASAGHGTTMFVREPAFVDAVAQWISE